MVSAHQFQPKNLLPLKGQQEKPPGQRTTSAAGEAEVVQEQVHQTHRYAAHDNATVKLHAVTR